MTLLDTKRLGVQILYTALDRAGARAIDLGRPSVYQGGQNLKLSARAAVIKRESFLIGGGASMSDGGQACRMGGQAPLSDFKNGKIIRSASEISKAFIDYFATIDSNSANKIAGPSSNSWGKPCSVTSLLSQAQILFSCTPFQWKR